LTGDAPAAVELRRLCTGDVAAGIIDHLEALKDGLVISLIDKLARVMDGQGGLESLPLMRKLLTRCRTTGATAAGLATALETLEQIVQERREEEDVDLAEIERRIGEFRKVGPS
jgi:hypothetical protein